MSRFAWIFLWGLLTNGVFGQAPMLALDSIRQVPCNGVVGGSVWTSASGGVAPYLYTPSNDTLVYSSGEFVDFFPAGSHFVAVVDAAGASDTVFFTITEPEPFDFQFQSGNARCFGEASGTITVSLGGGTLPYAFLWENGDAGPISDSLAAGIHFVTVTDAAGCIAVSAAMVDEPSPVLADSFIVEDVICFGDTNGSVLVLPVGGTGFFSYTWNNGATTPVAVALPAGVFVVTVTDQNGCTGSGAAAVTQPPPLQVFLQQIIPATCRDTCNGVASITVVGGRPGYAINWGLPGFSPDSLFVGNLCAGNYTITATDAAGCTATLTFDIAQPPALSIQLQSLAPTCAGESNGQAQASALGGTPPYTFAWSTGQTGAVADALPCGPIRVVVQDANQCRTSAMDSLPCVPPLLVDVLSAEPVRCFGDADGRISITPTGGQAPYAYLWSDPNAQTGPVASNLAPGSYTVTVTDAFGCTSVAQATVIEPPPLGVAIQSVNVVCTGERNGSASATVAGGTPPYQYLWNTGAAANPLTGLPPGTYFATVTDQQGCSAITPPGFVAEPSEPVTLLMAQTRASCYGQNDGAAAASAAGGNGPPFTFLWNNGQAGPAATGLAPGIYTATATDALGCRATDTVEVVALDSIRVNVIFTRPTCKGYSDGRAAINLVQGGAGMGDTSLYSYQWSVPGISGTLLIDSLAGNMNYGVTVTDLQGCSASADFFLPDAQSIQLVGYVTDVACSGDSTGEVGIASAQGAYPIVSYVWTTGSMETALSAIPAGDYGVTVTDAKGCRLDTVLRVPEPLPLQVVFDVDPLLCFQGKDAAIRATVSGGVPAYTFFWNNGATIDLLAGIGAGTYTVRVLDENDCVVVDSITIAEPPEPEYTVTGNPPDCFGGRNGSIVIDQQNLVPPIRYSLNDKPFGSASVFKNLPAGLHRLRIRDGNGCTYTDTVLLAAPAPIQVGLDADTTIRAGDTLVLTAAVVGALAPVQYSWSSVLAGKTACADSACSGLTVAPLQPNTYRVQVTDARGCTAEATVRVDVDQNRLLYVPTAFSPNGDQNNDLLVVHGPGQGVSEIMRFSVYDRWGEEVYTDTQFLPNTPARGWDGMFRGSPCDGGVYAWVIEVRYIDGQIGIFTGNTTLLR
ncbi:MAG: gliding motility-associated C-terminal domain-containing protein [Saprospiraceae bacterium]|nr:gliding motility-associated C-terminal domain-containing protein [Saprospiraceae bacterium]